MELQFNQTEAHLYDFAKQHWKNILNTKVFRLVGVFILILLVLNILFAIINGSTLPIQLWIEWLIPLAILVALWIFLIPIFMKRQFRNPATAKIALGERHIYLNEDKVIVKTPNSETSFDWNIITKLKDSKMSYFLYVGQYQAIIILKSVFINPTERTDFENFIANKIDATL